MTGPRRNQECSQEKASQNQGSEKKVLGKQIKEKAEGYHKQSQSQNLDQTQIKCTGTRARQEMYFKHQTKPKKG